MDRFCLGRSKSRVSLASQSEAQPVGDTVPDDDRCFRYGDGLFETLLVIDGQILWLELHLQRLSLGAERLAMDVDLCRTGEQLKERASAFASGATTMRVTVSRGSGPRGYLPGPHSSSRVRIDCGSLGFDPLLPAAPAVLALSSIFLAEQPLLAGIKHCNRLEQVLGAAEAARLEVDDVLMRNSSGFLQCTSRSNFFVLRDGELLTASCEQSGILGTRRRLVIESLAPALGLEVREAAIKPDDLRASDSCFVTNTLIGIRSVSRLDQCSFAQQLALAALHNAYREEAQACLRR